MDTVLSQIYYDPSNPSAFSSAENLFQTARKVIKSLTREDVQNWLDTQDTYTLHRRVVKKFSRVPIVAEKVDHLWQADLADVRHLSQFNNNYNYILIVIDILSRFVFVRALPSKTSPSVAAGLRDIIESSGRKPRMLQTDPGREWIGRVIDKLMKDYGIHHWMTPASKKVAAAERFIRTLKEKMYKYFTANRTYFYLDVLQNIVDAYNNSKHRMLKLKPAEIRGNEEKESEAYVNLYGDRIFHGTEQPKFQENDLVRLVKDKKRFAKGAAANYGEQMYRIADVALDRPPRVMYTLEDLKGQRQRPRHYSQELVKVRPPADPLSVAQVESVLDRRVRDGVREKLVKYQGYPSKFNRWIRDENGS